MIPDVAKSRALTPSRASRSICLICRMVSSLLAGIRFPSLINEGLDARGTDPNENADPPQKPGRKLIGMPAGFISEWWPASFRNGGRLHVGKPGRNKSEFALPRIFANPKESQAAEITQPFFSQALRRDALGRPTLKGK